MNLISKLTNKLTAKLWTAQYDLEMARHAHAAQRHFLSEAGCCLALTVLRWVVRS